jgi:DnaB helicase-like protein
VDSLSIRAEQAMLGAVLSDPAGQQHLLDLVERADMRRPWHGQVLAAMERLRERGVAPGPLEVYRELRNDPDLPPSVARNGVLLADLMELAPRAGHAGAYAAMVVEGGIRQRVFLAGSRIAQAADSGDLEAALDLAGRARRELDRCRARWLALPEPVRRELPAPRGEVRDYAETGRRSAAVREESGRTHGGVLAGTGNDPSTHPASPRPDPAVAAGHDERQVYERERGSVSSDPAAATAEARALRDLAAAPSHLAVVRGWLSPGHFARAGHGVLYAVMQDMDMAGKPVDPVTVAWEAARRGVRADPVALAGGTGLFAVASAREVHRRGLLVQAADAGWGIQADAANPACSPRQLFQAAGERLLALPSEPAPGPRSSWEAQVLALPSPAAAGSRTREPDREAVR